MEYLKKQNFLILARNWRCRIGEIDIVAAEGETLVIVEVKTRRAERPGSKHLFDNITYPKKQKLRRLTELYVHFNFYCRKPYKKLRIDVIGVLLSEKDFSVVKIIHLKNAI